MTPEAWAGGLLIAYKHGQEEAGTYVSGPIQLIEPRTGRVSHEISVPGGCVGVSSSERWVIGTGYREKTIIWCRDPREAAVAWSKTLDEGVVKGLVISEDTVVCGMSTGEVLALDAATGERRWTSTVADLSWRRESGLVEPGTVRDRPSVFGDHVILNVVHHHVVGVSVQDGSRTWTWGDPPFAVKYGQRFEDRYYVIDWTGECRILDAATGREIAAINLSRQLPRDQGLRLVPPLLVNATHILIGSDQGNVTAFARDTGAFAWTCRTREGGSTEYGEIGFVVGNNRVYFGDSTFRIRCLGPRLRPRRGAPAHPAANHRPPMATRKAIVYPALEAPDWPQHETVLSRPLFTGVEAGSRASAQVPWVSFVRGGGNAVEYVEARDPTSSLDAIEAEALATLRTWARVWKRSEFAAWGRRSRCSSPSFAARRP